MPFSLASGLEEAGASVLHVRAEPGVPLELLSRGAVAAMHAPRARSVRTCRTAAYNGHEMGAVRSWAASRRLRAAGPLDGVVQVGSSYSLPESEFAVVTHDDMTVVQAARAGYPTIAALSRRQREGRIERQRAAFNRALACCVVTGWAKQSIVEDYGIAEEKVHVVGGGRNHEPRPVERDWSTPRFLFVGKDWERKNGPAVLRAFARLREQIAAARLDVVGNHPPIDAPGVVAHGPLRLADRDERRRMDALFESATCFVMPSLHEPSGIVFSEANAAGVPSIGTTEGGAGELIGDAGRVVHPADDDALLAAMLELSDPATARELAARARKRSSLFTWPKVGERLLRALRVPDCPKPLAEFL